jgi:hypothetical protein
MPFSRLCTRRQEDKPRSGELNTLTLDDDAEYIMCPPVTTEPAIPPAIRARIEAVHNSVVGHFGVDYTRKVLLGRGVNDEGLRRYITKFVRDCLVCQLRSAVNRQIMTNRFTTASYTPMEVLNIDTIDPVTRTRSRIAISW